MLDFVRWEVQGIVLHMRLSGVVTLENMKRMTEEGERLIAAEALRPLIYAINDMTAITGYDKDVLSLRNIHSLFPKNHRTLWMVVVDPHPNPVMKFMGLTMRNIFKVRMYMANTFEEAIEFLQAREAEPFVRRT